MGFTTDVYKKVRKDNTLTGQTMTQLYIAEYESEVQQGIVEYLKGRNKKLRFKRFQNNDGVIHEDTDGPSKPDYVSILFEFKLSTNLSNLSNVAKKLCQAIVYLQRMDESTTLKTPKVVALVDKDEFLTFETNKLVKFLSLDIDWNSKSAHDAYLKFPTLNTEVLKDLEDGLLNYDYHKITEKSLPIIYDQLVQYCRDSVQKRPVTSNKIKKAFDYFEEEVLKTKLKSNDSVNLFVQLFTNPKSNKLNTDREDGVLITESFGNNKIKVDVKKYGYLMNGFDINNFKNYEKTKIISTQDTLIEDAERRRIGAFYTMSVWAEQGNLCLDSVFSGFREKNSMGVWDSSAGTGNLTRGFNYKRLLQTTLETSDVDTILQHGANYGSIVLPFDRLSTPNSFLPKEINSFIEGSEELISYQNPPYGTSTNFGPSSKEGISNTIVKKLMKENGLGACSDQLFAQFLFQDIDLHNKTKKKVHIAYFFKPIFFTGPDYKSMREFMGKTHKFVKGFVFNAKEFAGVKSWPLIFAIFECGVSEDSNDFTFDVLERQGIDVVKIGEKTFYNTDNHKSAKDWLKQSWVNKKDDLIFVPTINGFDVPVSNKNIKDTVKTDFIGFLHNNANKVQFNSQFVGLYTMPFASSHGVSFDKDGFFEATMMFVARKLVKLNWLNDQDEYLEPNREHVKYDEFKYMSIIKSIFSEGSNQTSWINKEYKGTNYRVKNNFFPFIKTQIEKKIDKVATISVYNDFNVSDERFVANLFYNDGIFEILPENCKNILREYFKLYVKYVDRISDEGWDIGYVQLKKLMSQSETQKFQKLLSELDSYMLPLVYELGFLMK
jgi:hypothetical protein